MIKAESIYKCGEWRVERLNSVWSVESREWSCGRKIDERFFFK